MLLLCYKRKYICSFDMQQPFVANEIWLLEQENKDGINIVCFSADEGERGMLPKTAGLACNFLYCSRMKTFLFIFI